MAVAMVPAVLAWITFPGGGVYPSIWVPAAVVVLLHALVVRPRIHATGADSMLIAAVAAIALQLVPLPIGILGAFDPHVSVLRRRLWLSNPQAVGEALVLPVSLLPWNTLAALGIVSMAALFFWICRSLCQQGHAGRIIRATAAIGLLASIGAIVQGGHSRELLWGIWQPLDPGARPYGPFVNRNHFATWLIMACPLVFGYVLARAPGRSRSPLLAQRIAESLQQLGTLRIWLVVSVSVMALALLISTSRSGLIGLTCGLTVSTVFMKGHARSAVRRWAFLQVAMLVLVAVSFANFDSLMGRFDQALKPSGAGRGRGAVWSDTLRMIGDFPITGTGAGTFGTTIAAYQTSEPGYSIGNAHNHYLQLAAEGGLLVSIPAALCLGAGVLLFRRRLKEDSGPDRLIRAGAMSGIAAVLLQSVWETGLRMPANAMLLAMLAAMATYAPPMNQRERTA
jgi:O-antigen ligase